jgi:hypothetical protein
MYNLISKYECRFTYDVWVKNVANSIYIFAPDMQR